MDPNFIRYPELALATQASAHTIENWIARKLFVPSINMQGKRRRFTIEDVDCAAVMAFAADRCRLPVIVAACIATFARHLQHDLGEADNPLFVIVDVTALEKMTPESTYLTAEGPMIKGDFKGLWACAGWGGKPGSVTSVLLAQQPVGCVIINMTDVAKEARQRLRDALSDSEDGAE